MSHLSFNIPGDSRTPPTQSADCLVCGQPFGAHGRFDACPNGGDSVYVAGARKVTREEAPELWADRAHVEAKVFTAPVLVRKTPQPRKPQAKVVAAPKPKVKRGPTGPNRAHGNAWNRRHGITLEGIMALQDQGLTIALIARQLGVTSDCLFARLREAAAEPKWAAIFAQRATCPRCKRVKAANRPACSICLSADRRRAKREAKCSK